jgi:hypothetical protein
MKGPRIITGKVVSVELPNVRGYRAGDFFQGCQILEVYPDKLLIDVPYRAPRFAIPEYIEAQIKTATEVIYYLWQDFDEVMPNPRIEAKVVADSWVGTRDVTNHHVRFKATGPGSMRLILTVTDSDGDIHTQEVVIKAPLPAPILVLPPVQEIQVGTPVRIPVSVSVAERDIMIWRLDEPGEGKGKADVKVLATDQGWVLEVTATQVGYVEIPIIAEGMDASTNEKLCLRIFPALPAPTELKLANLSLEVGQSLDFSDKEWGIPAGLDKKVVAQNLAIATVAVHGRTTRLTALKTGRTAIKVTLSNGLTAQDYSFVLTAIDVSEVETVDALDWLKADELEAGAET